MRMYDLIEKKKHGQELTSEEIEQFVEGVCKRSIPDEQTAALLMAIYFTGLSDRETFDLTFAMRDSGDILDLSAVNGVCVDKHSTGGVGDKVSLLLLPILSEAGLPVVKMSGRGLGLTGGTIDKLEAIPGFNCNLTEDAFISQVNEVGGAIACATADLAPADKLIYALRDTTATVDNISLIASSIMSKKLAAGCDAIVLDVTTGDGAFMRERSDAKKLADLMVRIGKAAGKDVFAYITAMDEPLGEYVGNGLEVYESILGLSGKGRDDLMEVVYTLGGRMLIMGGVSQDMDSAGALMKDIVESGRALDRLKLIIKAQSGDPSCVDDPDIFLSAPVKLTVTAKASGYISRLSASGVGHLVKFLGGGRDKKEDPIDPLVGIRLLKKTGDRVESGDELAIIYASDEGSAKAAAKEFLNCITISDNKPSETKVIIDSVES